MADIVMRVASNTIREKSLKGKGMSMAGLSLFRQGNASPSANNLSLLRKMSKYLEEHNPCLNVMVRMDSAGYNHRVMGYCDECRKKWQRVFIFTVKEEMQRMSSKRKSKDLL